MELIIKKIWPFLGNVHHLAKNPAGADVSARPFLSLICISTKLKKVAVMHHHSP